jgi:ethanolamine ammonia-lyase small subunit
MTTPVPRDEPSALDRLRERTPARLFPGRAGAAYGTTTQLELRADHAFARDAVGAELDLVRDLCAESVERYGLFEVQTRATSKAEYLVRPDLGRMLSEEARAELARRCPAGVDLQVAIGDGLSVAAVARQVPGLLPLIDEECARRSWTFGQPFVVRYCRVGVLNDLGEVLQAAVVVLLIGERPGLATAEGLSAYLAYRPRSGHTDADRNLISNIHARGVLPDLAARRIAALAAAMRAAGQGGVSIKEENIAPE